METADFDNQQSREAAEAAMESLQNLLDHCEGIELDACLCQSMSEMTVAVFRDFSIWDYDELSLDAGGQPPPQFP